MKEHKKYVKPKFAIINFSEDLLDGGINGSNPEDRENDEFGIKIQSFRIFDDSFDDLSSVEESDYTTTTNTFEVW